MFTVYAVATDVSRFYYVEKDSYGFPVAAGDKEWSEYLLEGVAPGDYFVVAAPRDSQPWHGGYTKFVRCGGTVACAGTDHTLASVHVTAGATVSGIDPSDGVDSSLIPSGGPPPIPVIGSVPSPPAFQNPKQAAVAYLGDQYVESSSACQVNLACAWLTGERDGQAAAYFTYELGTNGLFRTCKIYLTSTSLGWQLLEQYRNCYRLTSAFPAVGSTGQIAFQPYSFETGCVNVHAAPGLSTRVVACLPEGTSVTIDDGPYYLSEPTSPLDLTKNYWWQIVNQGWVVHRYLEWSA
jgi:hypothetical protein